MPERKVLSRRRLLHEKTSFTVPEHGVRTRPPDVDVLPEARCKRRLNVVIQIARGPLLVGLARGERSRCLAIQEDVRARRWLTRHEGVAALIRKTPLHQRQLSPQRECKPARSGSLRDRGAR